jgi:hypothetical protein
VIIFTKYRRSIFVLSLLIAGTFVLSRCVDSAPEEKPVVVEDKSQTFAGSATCAKCHQDVYDDHLRTAHFLTSQPAEEQYIKGSTEPGKNQYAYSNSVAVAIERRSNGFYQVEYVGGQEKVSKKMDIVVGSGTMGQSFLNWRDSYLFQLPITYFSAAHTWSNSPGYPNRVVFNRVITSRCLECHTTYVKTLSAPGKEPEQFDKNKIVYGVDCEKCHGPAAGHVKFHESHPSDSVAKFVVNPATFTRQQKLDLCALCHGGRLQKTKPSFSFTAGESLNDYFVVDTSAPNPLALDVHGNQYGLLRASQCFIQSDMTCNTCHDVHKNEKNKKALFSSRCMSCHSPEHDNFCPMEKKIGKSIVTNCIDCHMPLLPSRAIAVFLADSARPTAAMIRSHLIKVYERSNGQ